MNNLSIPSLGVCACVRVRAVVCGHACTERGRGEVHPEVFLVAHVQGPQPGPVQLLQIRLVRRQPGLLQPSLQSVRRQLRRQTWSPTALIGTLRVADSSCAASPA